MRHQNADPAGLGEQSGVRREWGGAGVAGMDGTVTPGEQKVQLRSLSTDPCLRMPQATTACLSCDLQAMPITWTVFFFFKFNCTLMYKIFTLSFRLSALFMLPSMKDSQLTLTSSQHMWVTACPFHGQRKMQCYIAGVLREVWPAWSWDTPTPKARS